MSVHDYHEGLPNYSAAQIWHDGCAECESRAKRDDHGLSTLDRHSFADAWKRAADWNRSGLPDISLAERGLLSMLWSVQIKLEPRGIAIGEVPSGF
jgi:hypothetical protein